MLRLAVAALLLVNLVFWAWTQGWLDDVAGTRALGDREPERAARQRHPELIRVLPASAASGAVAAAAAPSCLEAGPFAADEIGSAEAAARAALPAESRAALASARIERAGTWIVYMGRFADRAALTKKTEELDRRRVSYEEVDAPPALEGGLSLGRFDDRAAAERALAQFGQQGIRTARVVELNAPGTAYMLRAASADAALAGRLAALRPDALAGRRFSDCATTTKTAAAAPR
jgi:hypothetical protein